MIYPLVIEHDLDNSLPDLGHFDAVISSFVIHHLRHSRKYSLYEEISQLKKMHETDMNVIREEMNNKFSQIFNLIQQKPILLNIKPEVLRDIIIG